MDPSILCLAIFGCSALKCLRSCMEMQKIMNNWFGKTAGYRWLKDLCSREDVEWFVNELVQTAQSQRTFKIRALWNFRYQFYMRTEGRNGIHE